MISQDGLQRDRQTVPVEHFGFSEAAARGDGEDLVAAHVIEDPHDVEEDEPDGLEDWGGRIE